MKIITTLTALLVSISVYSQDSIEYQHFKFYQNGEEITLKKVRELTIEYGVAKANLRQGRRDYAASQNIWRAFGRNLINGTAAYSSGVSAAIAFFAGGYWSSGGISDGDFHPSLWITAYTSGVVLTGSTYYYTSLLARREKFLKRADRKFTITSQKLNLAIEEWDSIQNKK